MFARIMAVISAVLAAACFTVAALLIAPPDVVEFGAAVLLPSLALLQVALLVSGALLVYIALRSARVSARTRRNVGVAALLSGATIAGAIALRETGAYSRSTLRFDDNSRTFEATLYRPRRTAGKVAAVVLLHGSGPMPRRVYHNIADRFARHGIAVFNVDKAGVGGSSGTYYGDNLGRDPVIERRAADARVALAELARRPDIDTAKIGVVALSQGGWIVPLLLQGDSPARYAVNLSGPAVSTGEEGMWSDWTGESADHFGLKPPLEPFETLDERLRSVQPSGFDPRVMLRRMNGPSLWLFGEWDSSLPTQASVRVLDSLRAIGVPVTVRVFAEANHGLMIVRGPNGSRLANFAPGVWDTVFAWLRRSGVSTNVR